MMRPVSPTVVGVAMLCAACSSPVVAGGNFGTVWKPVDNRYSSATGAATGLAGHWSTFDLYLTGDAGTRVNAVNMGYNADPSVHDEYIFQNGTVYEHATNPGYFAPPSNVFPFDPAIEFDTYVGIGAVPSALMATVGGSMNLTGLALRGIWFAVPGDAQWPPRIDESGEIFLMRLTVSNDTTQLGGIGSHIEIGTVLNGDPTTPTVYVTVPIAAYAVVAPAAWSGAPLLLLSGFAAARRRR